MNTEKNPITDEILRAGEILRRGVSDEALELLEKTFGYHLDTFQLVDAKGHPRKESLDFLTAEAYKRDGQKSVINWIKQRRTNKPKTP